MCACILHLEGNRIKEKDIRQFDDDTWNKVKEADRARHAKFKESKYFSIVLPNEYGKGQGYHSQCFKNFTAITGVKEVAKDETRLMSHSLRSEVDHPIASTSGVFRKECIFCRHVTKSAGRLKKELLASVETDQGEDSIRAAAEALHDERLITLLSGIDLKAKEVKYHHSCRKEYMNRAKNFQGAKIIPSEKTRQEDAFRLLKEYIDTTLVENEGAEYMSSLYRKYLLFYGTEDESIDEIISSRWLCEKVLECYPNALKKCKESKKKGNMICNVILKMKLSWKQHSSGVKQ
jgi:hypothetical protein